MGLALGPAFAVGHEMDLGRPGAGEQHGRIDVGVARSRSEVEWLGACGPDDLALADGVAPLDAYRRQERVARANAVGVQDDDVQGATHLTGEDDLTVGRGADCGARRGVVVEAAVAGAVRVRRRAEGIGDRGGDRRVVPTIGGGRGGAHGPGYEEGDDAENQCGEAHERAVASGARHRPLDTERHRRRHL